MNTLSKKTGTSVPLRFDRPTPIGIDAKTLADLQWQADSTAAIAELLHRVLIARTIEQAHLIVANELCAFIGAEVVAIGSVRIGSARVCMKAMSDVAQVDASADMTNHHSDAMSESIIRHRELDHDLTVSELGNQPRELMQLAHQELLKRSSMQLAWSCPLVDETGNVVGVWTALFRSCPANKERLVRFASATGSLLAEALQTCQHATEGPIARLSRSIKEAKSSTRFRHCVIGAAIVFAAFLVPVPHRVSCDSVLQPTGQRFAVAPHDGILKHSLVRAGDKVVAGQLLAEMEATELELQVADMSARYQRAKKKADIHQSENDPAATQLATLEAIELTAQLELLKHRLSNRRIISPIDGFVLRCELDESSGVPVRSGDVLMQVAPVTLLRAELEIPESQLPHVEIGQRVHLIADGKPLDRLNTQVEKIRPMSEVRNGQNIFIAEVSIDNADGRLRPGMKGSTKISTGYRSAGWVLFHRAAERAYRSLR